jgi:hypothetical protein
MYVSTKNPIIMTMTMTSDHVQWGVERGVSTQQTSAMEVLKLSWMREKLKLLNTVEV